MAIGGLGHLGALVQYPVEKVGSEKGLDNVTIQLQRGLVKIVLVSMSN